MATARYHKVKIGEHELNAETLMNLVVPASRRLSKSVSF
jgi:hypothetical protein